MQPKIAVHPCTPDDAHHALSLARRLTLPMVNLEEADADYFLTVGNHGLAIVACHQPSVRPIRIDFGQSNFARRLQYPQKETLIQALGRSLSSQTRIVDATAGFGYDALLMASRGFSVTCLEQSPIVYALLSEALQRAQGDERLREWASAIQLHQCDAHDRLPSLQADIVYIDPMFPVTKKSAQSKKEMVLLQSLLPPQEDPSNLLDTALNHAQKRVIIKRPIKAAYVADKRPSYSVKGKAIRFDVYVNA